MSKEKGFITPGAKKSTVQRRDSKRKGDRDYHSKTAKIELIELYQQKKIVDKLKCARLSPDNGPLVNRGAKNQRKKF